MPLLGYSAVSNVPTQHRSSTSQQLFYSQHYSDFCAPGHRVRVANDSAVMRTTLLCCPLEAIQVLRNAVGYARVSAFGEKSNYEDVQFNVISVTRGVWV